MITRHFYESEHVVAALQRAVLLRRSQEAAFWCQELIDSKEEELAYKALYQIWLLFINYMNATWYAYYQSRDVSLQELCFNLSVQEDYDASTIGVFLLQDQPVDRVIGNHILSQEEYFKIACQQGRIRSAWWIRSNDIVENKLIECGKLVFECGNKRKCEWRLIPDAIQKQIAVWKDKEGHRSRRIYSIPFSQLYGEELYSKERLYTIEKTIIKDGCTFWRRALEKYGYINISGWKSDDALERFYETYFPDDIPDEWSKEDQEKSHTVAGKSVDIVLSRWLRIWMPSGTLMRSIWGFEKDVLEKMVSYTWREKSIFEFFESITIDHWTCQDMKKQLSGCKRMYVTNEEEVHE